MRSYLIVLSLTAGIILLLPSGPNNALQDRRKTNYTRQDSYLVRVVRVVDGDTVKVQFKNGIRDTVRLLGVDVPETSAGHTDPEEFGYPNTEQARERLAEWGTTATAWLKRRLHRGEIIRIVLPHPDDSRGSFHRLLAYVYTTNHNRSNKRHKRYERNDEIDAINSINAERSTLNAERNVNKQLIKHGLARVYDTSFQEKESFLRLEENAIRKRTGVWQKLD